MRNMDDDETPPDNETMRAVKRAKASAEAAADRKMGWKTAAGIGIGSAAVVAALIYANKSRKKEED
jgi:hypothetical protein